MKRKTNRDQLVFDEPELNLHPVRLKRKLPPTAQPPTLKAPRSFVSCGEPTFG
jgi:hypothetical protein